MNPTVVKVASLIAGVVIIALAVLAPGLSVEIRLGIIAIGGFLVGYTVTPPGAGKAVGATLALLFALSPALPACSSGATPEAKQPTLEDLEQMCPGAARAMSLDCPAIAIAKCGDAKSLDECAAKDAVESECDALIDKEIAKCN